jgi:hypothetical protein
MNNTHKSGAKFDLPDDITHGQLEKYEIAVRDIVAEAKQRTDSVLARAAITGALEAGIITNAEGCPAKASEIEGAGASITFWMGERIARYIVGIKSIDQG